MDELLIGTNAILAEAVSCNNMELSANQGIDEGRHLALLWRDMGEIERLVNADNEMDQATWHKFRIGNLLKELADNTFQEHDIGVRNEVFEESMKLYDRLTQLALRIQNAEVERLERGRIVNPQSKQQDRRLRKLHRQIQEKQTKFLAESG